MNIKYIVICYSLHDMKIVGCTAFNTEEEAIAFMKKDAITFYEEEIEEEGDAELIDYHTRIYVSSHSMKYEWTWDIRPILG